VKNDLRSASLKSAHFAKTLLLLMKAGLNFSPASESEAALASLRLLAQTRHPGLRDSKSRDVAVVLA
jgi:hypothetical protein